MKASDTRSRVLLAMTTWTVAVGACRRAPEVPVPPVVARSEGVPSTDIYLYQLSRGLLHRGRRLVNLTNRPGYDNQPSFVGSTLYYTSVRDGQADIYKFE